MTRPVTLLALILALLTNPADAGLFGSQWQERQVRVGIELGQFVWPVFHETPRVERSGMVMVGLAWTPIDRDEWGDPNEDGLKDIGLWAGGNIDIQDPFSSFQIGAGVTYTDLFHVGMALWIGNAVINDNVHGVQMRRIHGVDMKLLTVAGIGVGADPD